VISDHRSSFPLFFSSHMCSSSPHSSTSHALTKSRSSESNLDSSQSGHLFLMGPCLFPEFLKFDSLHIFNTIAALSLSWKGRTHVARNNTLCHGFPLGCCDYGSRMETDPPQWQPSIERCKRVMFIPRKI
jgi:hypothetical protein